MMTISQGGRKTVQPAFSTYRGTVRIIGTLPLNSSSRLPPNSSLGTLLPKSRQSTGRTSAYAVTMVLMQSTLHQEQSSPSKKGLCAIFHQHGLQVTIEANKKIVNFLDVTLDLENGTHTPHKKSTDDTQKKCNHYRAIFKQIPEATNKRLSSLCHDEHPFNKAKPVFHEVLKKRLQS